MGRVIYGFILAPLLAGVVLAIATGSGEALLFMPLFTYPLTLIFALPVFLLFWKLKWLQWWHATGMGLAIAIGFAWLFLGSANPYHVEIYGIADASVYLATGYSIAFAFWCIAVFRNQAFDYVSKKPPVIPAAIAVALIGGTSYVQFCVRPINAVGQIVALLPPANGKPMASVKLDSGETIQARMMCYSTYPAGVRVNLDHRPRSLFWSDRYWIEEVITDPAKFNMETWQSNATSCYNESIKRK